MQRTERIVLEKIIKYCDDIEALLNQFQHDYQRYCNEIAFQYACNMCIIQIGELVSRLPANTRKSPGAPSKGCGICTPMIMTA